MPKESGLGITVAVDDHLGAAKTLDPDITSFDFATPRGVIDSTGVSSSANERLLALADFSCTLNGLFNDESDKSHDVGKTAASTTVTRTVTIVHSSQTLATECALTDYALSRGADGALTWTMPLALNSTSVPSWS